MNQPGKKIADGVDDEMIEKCRYFFQPVFATGGLHDVRGQDWDDCHRNNITGQEGQGQNHGKRAQDFLDVAANEHDGQQNNHRRVGPGPVGQHDFF